MNEDMENREENISITSQLPKLLIIIAIIIALICGTWYAAHSLGWFQYALFDFGFLTNSPPAVTATVTSSPTAEPAISPTPALENQQAGEQAQVTPVPTAPPTVAPTEPPAPTPAPTVAPAAHATYTLGKDIHVMVNGKEEIFRTFTYSGGYIPADDPWFAPEKEKETPESYGRPIYGKTPQELTYNWLREVCKSPHQVIRLRTQMGMITPKTLEKEDKLAFELAAKPAKDYDAVVNETLQFFFKKLDGGRIESSTDWDLENYMLAVTKNNDSGEINLRGRENHDDDTKPEDKDILLTFYAKGSKTTFVSSKRGWLNTANDAKVSSSKYSQRAWVNMTEGGTWKWKAKGGSGGNTNPPGGNTPTPAPTSTPTPGPTSTPRPAKDPSQQPTVSDAPVGGGGTNPQNSADPHTTDHVESTPAPAATATPAPTAAPTAVPTAVVRPTEVCETVAPTPIREDQATPPPADPGHNVPTDKPAGTGDTDFDPGSI